MQLIFTSGTGEEMKYSEEKFLEDDDGHVSAQVRETCSYMCIRRENPRKVSAVCCIMYMYVNHYSFQW